MVSAATVTDATRLALGLMVDREERRSGSRDLAFEIVAATVGTSASWVKKFVSRSGEVKEPRITLFLKIREAYDRVVTCVEQEQAIELLKISKLRGELHAATEGLDRMVAHAAAAQASGARAGRGSTRG